MPPAARKTAKKATVAKTAAEKAKAPADHAAAPANAPQAPPPPPAAQAPPPPPGTPLVAGLDVPNVTVEGQTIDAATAAFTESLDPDTGATPPPGDPEPAQLAKKDIPDGLVPFDVNGDTDTWLLAERDIYLTFIPRGVTRPSSVLLVAARGTITRQALAERLAMYADAQSFEVK